MVNLGDVFPDFEADTSAGHIKFHDWLGDSWAILFSHPADYTPVCTTELGKAAELAPEFEKRNCKMIALSCDGVDDHKGWIEDIKSYSKLSEFPYQIIADEKRDLAVKLGMVDPDEKDKAGLPLTCRAVFIIKDKKLKLSMLYPATTGRNFNEILRVLDSLQLTAREKCATPVDWQQGDACMVLPSLSAYEAKQLFPKHVHHSVPSGKSYLRTTK
uniref:1-Cys peroxiredoxin n=1 Tax=Hirondellea gigas TaxID=1518452 RepID=A0A2P2HWY7_9CRUS